MTCEYRYKNQCGAGKEALELAVADQGVKCECDCKYIEELLDDLSDASEELLRLRAVVKNYVTEAPKVQA